MIEFLCGLLGFVLSLGIFALGFYFGRKVGAAPAAVERDPLTETELEKIRKERERMEQDQAAFRLLTGYSADIAYGNTNFPEEGVG